MDNRGVVRVDIVIPTNAWWVDSFQFGDLGDTTWSFVGKSFLLDVKQNATDTTPMLSCSSAGGTLVVTDTINRILNMLVTDIAIRSAFPSLNGTYKYDLIMVDNSTGERDMLMYGELCVVTGVTVED